jgi:hypothetical protein
MNQGSKIDSTGHRVAETQSILVPLCDSVSLWPCIGQYAQGVDCAPRPRQRWSSPWPQSARFAAADARPTFRVATFNIHKGELGEVPTTSNGPSTRFTALASI